MNKIFTIPFSKSAAISVFLISFLVGMHVCAQVVCNAEFNHYSSPHNPDSVHFYNSSPAGTVFLWSFGDGTSSNTNEPWHLYSSSGTYHVCLTITNTASGCSATWCDSVLVTAPPPPVCNSHFNYYPSPNNADSIHFYSSNTSTTGIDYLWTFGDGTSSTSNIPWHFYATSGSYYVCLTITITNAGGTCTSTSCDSVHVVGPLPPVCNAHFSFYPSTHNPDSIHFANSSVAANTVFFWNFGDGTSSTSNEPWRLYAASGTYYVCLTVTTTTSGGTCTATSCDSVHVSAPPPPVCNAHFNYYPSPNNADSIHFYSSNTSTTGIDYLWTFGDGTSSTSNIPWHLYATSGSYYVCLTITITNAGGTCTSTSCDSVHVVGPLPPVCNAHFSFYPSTHNPDSIHFANSSPAASTVYFWNFGDGSSSSSNEPWHLYGASGTYYVCLTVTTSNAGGTCTATFCDSVHVDGPLPPVCNAHFSFYPSTHNPDSIHFANSSLAANTVFFWNFGDGTSSSSNEPWHLYAASGTYYVCLTVTTTTSGGTCTATSCDSVHVVGPLPPVCNAHFSFYPSTHNPDSIHFANSSLAANTVFFWNFGDGTSSSSNEPWHLYGASGTYYVCLTVTTSNAGGTCTATSCDSVHVVGPLPPVCNAHFSFYPSTHNPDSIHFANSSLAANTVFFWNFGDGTSSSSNEPWHLYAASGTYYVCLTVTTATSGGTCTATSCDSVRVVGPLPPVCNAHFSFYPSTHNPDSIHFANSSPAASTVYFWNFGDGTSSSSNEPWHLYAASGTYYVCLTVTTTTSGGTCTATSCDSVHVVGLLPPVCNAHFSYYPSPYNPDSIHFYSSNTSTTGINYLWTFGDGTSSTSNVPWHLYATSGTYYVCLTITITNAGGTCTSTSCDSVHVLASLPPVCDAHFSFYPSTHNPDSIHFANSSVAANTVFFWNFGDGTLSSSNEPWHLYTASGTYYVCLTVTTTTSGGTCTATSCDSIHVVPPVPPVCNAHFNYYPSAHNVDSVHFYNSSPAGTSYLWDFGDGSSATTADPWHLFASSGTYNVCLTVTSAIAGLSCTNTYCTIVGIPHMSISVFPNLANDYSKITLVNLNSHVDFRIMDVSGVKRMELLSLSDGTFYINTIDLRSGIYYYEVDDGNQILSRGKLIVTH